MTIRIVDNFLHHPYTTMTKAIMPSFECINILENYLVRNMWYEFNVCVVQTGGKEGIFSTICLSYPLFLVTRRISSLLSSRVSIWKPF